MDTTQAEITKFEENLSEINAQANDIYIKFIKDTAICLRSWYEQQITDYIGKNAAEYQRTDINQRKKAKAEAQRIMDSFDKVLPDQIKDLGWHNHYFSDIPKISKEKQFNKENAQKLIFDLIGKMHSPFAGTLFARFNLAATANRFQWSEDMSADLKDYQATFEKAIPIAQKLIELENQQQKDTQEKRATAAISDWRNL